jgi:prevent-host-death family protein
MVVNTITEAKRRLSELIEKVQEGEEVIINKAGKPVALLTAYKKHKVPRKPGALKGKIHIAENFDELPDDIARSFGMGFGNAVPVATSASKNGAILGSG